MRIHCPSAATSGSVASKVLLSFAAIGAAASIAGLGTFATFTDVEAPTTAIDTGIVAIDQIATTDITTAFADMVPGDSGVRYITLDNTGDVDLASVKLTTTATPSNLLTVDAGTDTNGLEVRVDRCTVAWALGACTGTPTTPVSQRDILVTDIDFGALAQADTLFLKLTVSLPTAADNDYQNLSTTVTWTFTGTQRAAVTNK